MFFLKKSLYIVGIPIGNIYDFSQRAIFILKNVNFIVTEDSRKSGILLNFLNVKNKIISLNKYNELSISKKIIEKIEKNISIALISDSGTPLISDPGFFLIDFAYKNFLKIVPIPGISSLTTALSISLIKSKNFTFKGFLPKKHSYKKIILKTYIKEENTIIFFETSERLFETLHLMYRIFQQKRTVYILKDLTKKFEKSLIFELIYLDKAKKHIKQSIKGEFIIILDSFNNESSYIYKKKTATICSKIKNLNINYVKTYIF